VNKNRLRYFYGTPKSAQARERQILIARMIVVGASFYLMTIGEVYALDQVLNRFGTNFCTVYTGIKNYIAPVVALIFLGVAFLKFKARDRDAQPQALHALGGAAMFGAIGGIFQITGLQNNICPA
jgi:hypothetical protein